MNEVDIKQCEEKNLSAETLHHIRLAGAQLNQYTNAGMQSP